MTGRGWLLRNARPRSRGSRRPLGTNTRSSGCRRHAGPPYVDRGQSIAPHVAVRSERVDHKDRIKTKPISFQTSLDDSLGGECSGTKGTIIAPLAGVASSSLRVDPHDETLLLFALNQRLPVRVLITGKADDFRACIARIVASCPSPLVVNEREDFTEPAPDSGTIIMANVVVLSSVAQRRCYDWLANGGRDKVVLSISPIPLFPLVKRGQFMAELFYRLNVFTLHVGVGVPVSGVGSDHTSIQTN